MITAILKPNKIVLTIYGLFSLLFLVGYVWLFSFMWEYYGSVTYYVVGLMVVLLIGLLIAHQLDERYKGQIRLYFQVSLLQLLVIWLLANPIRSWQIESSLVKARRITDSLSLYKKQYGSYPTTLSQLEGRLRQDLPRKTNLGTRYWYKPKEKEQEYELKFLSYYGYTAYYSTKQDKWVLTD